MRTEYISGDDYKRDTGKTLTAAAAEEICPWACKIVKTEGGYTAFESQDDYDVWRNQK